MANLLLAYFPELKRGWKFLHYTSNPNIIETYVNELYFKIYIESNH
jgi:hypothetical protein